MRLSLWSAPSTQKGGLHGFFGDLQLKLTVLGKRQKVLSENFKIRNTLRLKFEVGDRREDIDIIPEALDLGLAANETRRVSWPSRAVTGEIAAVALRL